MMRSPSRGPVKGRKPMKMNNRALIFPLLSVLVVAVFAGGLGVTFILLKEISEWAVVGLGSALVVGVPAAAALGQRMVEKT
jgi:4-hydroxybenzoate polyprenyltransferase